MEGVRSLILLDSNIVIYLRDPARSGHIVQQLQAHDERLGTCNVIVAEVLGFNGLESVDSRYFKDFFATMKNYAFDELVTERVIAIRKAANIQLPDAIIAATALANDAVLWTHNTDDFSRITGLQLFDPLTSV